MEDKIVNFEIYGKDFSCVPVDDIFDSHTACPHGSAVWYADEVVEYRTLNFGDHACLCSPRAKIPVDLHIVREVRHRARKRPLLIYDRFKVTDHRRSGS